jgi:hypothetical protein
MLTHAVATGYYWIDERWGVYRPTWKGALLMTGKHAWPVRPIYRALRHRRTRGLLREAGVGGETG